MTDNQDSGVTMDKQVPPTDRPLTAGDWIEWHGGENPVPGQRVDYKDGWGRTWIDRASDDCIWSVPSGPCCIRSYRLFTDYRTARPATSAASEGEAVDAAKIVERLAYGYAIMHTAICHMAGTSGADGRWYYDKANEAFGRVSPIHALTERSNPHVPGDYYSGLSSILDALASPPVSERERELEAEVIRLRDVLLGIAETDHYRRYPKQHEDGGLRGQSGLRAVRALTGEHGSYVNDDEVRALDAEQRAALAARPAGEGK